jgi:hypothetical protein
MYNYTSEILAMDTFQVNTFMFIPNTALLAVAVDNYGMIVFDTSTRIKVEDVLFSKLIASFPERFSIFKFIPIGNNGIRVLIQNNGGFSFIWRSLGKFCILSFRKNW